QVRRLAIEPERRAERRHAELVGTERAAERVRREPRHEVATADDDARLRAAEELVAAERHEIGARGDAVAHAGAGRRPVRGLIERRAAGEMVQAGYGVLRADRAQPAQLDVRREADDPVVARVDLDEEARLRADGAAIVVGVRAIRRADLAEPRAG